MFIMTDKKFNEEIQKHDASLQKAYEDKMQKQNAEFQKKLNDLDKSYSKKLKQVEKQNKNKEKNIEKRTLVGGIPTRYTNWIFANLNKVNADITTNYVEVIKKCRYLAKNNPIIRSYLSSCVKNIVR